MEFGSRITRWQVWESRPLVQRILQLDERLLLRLARPGRPAFTHLMRCLTHLADPAGLIGIGGVAMAIHGGLPAWLLPTVGAVLLATLVVNVLKRWLCRPRPDVAIEGFTAVLGNPDAFAFPSGHTAAAFSAALVVGWQHPWLAPPLAALALAVGASRVHLGAHYPIDVLAGATIGCLSALTVLS